MAITRATNLAGLGTVFDSLTDGGGLSITGVSTFSDLNATNVSATGITTIKSLDAQTNSLKTFSDNTTWTSTSGSVNYANSDDVVIGSGYTFTVSSGSTYSLTSKPIVEFDLVTNDKLAIKIRGTDGSIRVGIVTLSLLQ